MWRLIPLTLATSVGVLCLVVLGRAALAIVIGGAFFTTILVPPLVLWRDAPRERVEIAFLVAAPMCVVAWLAARGAPVTLGHLLGCAVTLIAYAGCLAGVAMVLARGRIDRSIASALVTILGLAWLTWPIWFAPHLTGPSATRTAAVLVAAHPIFAVNGQLRQLGAWTHQGVMYRITSLGQDVPYELPPSVWPCVLVHAAIGALLVVIAMWSPRRRLPSPAPDSGTPPAAPAAP